MKKFLRNIAKILVVSVLLTSCASENLDIPNQDTSLVKAKKWFDASKPNLKVLNYTSTIDWNNSIISSGDRGTIIEVPLLLKDNIVAKVGDDKSFETFNRLIFIPDENETYKAYQVLITTNNKAFDSKSKECNFYKLNTDFNGYITVLNSKNEITDFDKYLDLKPISKPILNKTTTDPVVCVYYGYWDENNEFHSYFLVGCYGGGGSGSSGGTSYGSGGEKGDAEPGVGDVEIVIVGPSNIISNLNDYLKCFDLSMGATITIYVDQPTANSPDSWSGTITNPDVGHTFIAIQQGNIRRVFGYYPRDSVNPYSSPSGPSAFGNDQSHPFDVALSIPINASQLQTAISTSTSETSSTYNLNTFNCTDFGIKIGNLVGLNLPDAYGTWPGGGGSNPGQLGQYIRAMVIPLNAVRQTTSANSAPNNGVCN